MPDMTRDRAERVLRNSSTVRRDSRGRPRPMTHLEVLASAFKRHLRDTFSDAPAGTQTSGTQDITASSAGHRLSSGRQRQVDAALRGAVRGSNDSEFP